MTEVRKLKEHKYAQCYVYADYGESGRLLGVTLVSYVTPVVRIAYGSDGRRYVSCKGLYSATTRRQIGWFLKEYAPDLCYYDVKGIVGDGFVEM